MSTSTSSELPELGTRAQVAEYLQIAVVTLDRWADKGTGPKRVKISRAVRYRREDVLAFVAAQALVS